MKRPFQAAYTSVGPPWWDDAPVLVVGTGPSMKGFNFDRLRGLGHVLAVKASYVDLPWAELCFGLDLHWMKRDERVLNELAARMPLWLAVPEENDTLIEPPIIKGAHYLKRVRANNKLNLTPDGVEFGGNSGFGAFNFAVLKRAKQIVLFGYDYTSEHYCPERYTHQKPGHNARYFPVWARGYNATVEQIKQLGIEVLNASPISSMTAFRKVSHDDAFQYLDRIRSQRDAVLRGSEEVNRGAPDAADQSQGRSAVEASLAGPLPSPAH